MSASFVPLRLHLAHTPRLVRHDGQTLALNEKDAALLAMAALEGPIQRARVATMLWPGGNGDDPAAAEKRAQNNLRQRLFRINRFADHEVVTPGATLALSDAVAHDLALDADRFLADAQSASGELLGNFSYDDNAELAPWIDRQRQQWRASRADMLLGLVSRLEAEGRLGEALRLAIRLVTDEPLMEHASRMLMRLHYRRGDRGAALAEFERCKAALYEQLGDAPSTETVELVQTIGRDDVPAPGKPLALPLALRHPPRTVGRDTELLRAEHRWAQGGVVVLLGAAGMGKSRLTADLQRRWNITAQVQCRPESASSSFGLLGLLASALAPTLRDRLAPEHQVWLEWLVDPAHRIAPAPAVQPGKVAQVWQEIVRGAVAEGVAALSVEDLHYADEASLQVLVAQLPGVAPSPGPALRWLLSSRDNELPPALQTWIDRRPLGADPVVRLEPLSVQATREFLSTLGVAGAAPQGQDAVAAALQAHCGGHPLYMLQVLRQLQLAGELDQGRWPPHLPLPDDAMVSASQRRTRADPVAQQMAYLAALCGPDFSPGLMCRLMDRTAVALLAPWRRLEDLHIFGVDGFAHDLVREAVLAVVPKALAPLLHREIAQALAVGGADQLRLALHWEAGGDAARAAAAFAAAARVAQDCGLMSQAIEWLKRARAQYRLAGQPAAAFDCDWRCGHLMIIATSAQQAGELARQLVAQARSPTEHVMAGELLTRVKVELQDSSALADAREAVAGAEALGDVNQDTPLLTRCRLRLAEALAVSGEHDQALATLELLAAQAAGLDAEMRFTVASDRASVLATLGRRSDAISVHCSFLDQALAERNYAHASFSAGFCATHLSYLCRVSESVVLAEQSRSLARQAGIEQGLVLVDEMGLAGNLGDLGRFDDALALGEEVIAALRDNGLDVWAINATNDRAVILLRLGRPDRAQQLLRAPVGDVPLWVRAARKLVQARLVQWQGRDGSALTAEAAAMFDQVGAALHDYPRHKIALEAARSRSAEAAAAQGGVVVTWARTHQHVAFERYAHMVQIEALNKLGRVEEAAQQATELAGHEGVTREAFGYYLPELLSTLCDALWAAGLDRLAAPLHGAALAWIEDRCLRHVPPLFRESFMKRNPVNARLLAQRERTMQR